MTSRNVAIIATVLALLTAFSVAGMLYQAPPLASTYHPPVSPNIQLPTLTEPEGNQIP